MTEYMRKIILLLCVVGCVVGCKKKESACTPAHHSEKQCATLTMRGDTLYTVGVLPRVGEKAPDFKLTANDLSEKSLSKDYLGKFVVLNIFPSLDTKVCAQSVRTFNEKAADLTNTVVLCISKDLPFAQARFCGAEGIQNVVTLSDFRHSFGKVYGVQIAGGKLKGLLSRAVVVINPEGTIVYEEQVPDIGQEPNYEVALAAIK